jgi:hypothetical protein
MNLGADGRKGYELERSGAIHVGAKPGPEAAEAFWTRVLTIYLRIVSLLWIVQGLEQWRRIVAPASGSFLDLSTATISATIFFAVLNPIAAVGLWLVAPWGGVVWLLTLFAQVFVIVVKPSFFPFAGALKFADGALLALYLFLSWRASASSEQGGGVDRLLFWLREKTSGFRRES